METPSKEMPHIGAMLNKFMTENRITKAECARRMGVHPSQVTKFLQNYTIQTDTLWKFCIALNHDFLSELSPKLPVYKAPEEDPRIKELQMQIDVYKDILKR